MRWKISGKLIKFAALCVRGIEIYARVIGKFMHIAMHIFYYSHAAFHHQVIANIYFSNCKALFFHFIRSVSCGESDRE